jgi:hypothetical protein
MPETGALVMSGAPVIMRIPQDRSVFPVPALVVQVRGSDVPLADPLQQI